MIFHKERNPFLMQSTYTGPHTYTITILLQDECIFRRAKGSFFVNVSRSDNSILRKLAFYPDCINR